MDEQKVNKNEHTPAANEQEENIEVPDEMLCGVAGGWFPTQGRLSDEMVKIMKFQERQRRIRESTQQTGSE